MGVDVEELGVGAGEEAAVLARLERECLDLADFLDWRGM
jgi:hypothetical protein